MWIKPVKNDVSAEVTQRHCDRSAFANICALTQSRKLSEVAVAHTIFDLVFTPESYWIATFTVQRPIRGWQVALIHSSVLQMSRGFVDLEDGHRFVAVKNRMNSSCASHVCRYTWAVDEPLTDFHTFYLHRLSFLLRNTDLSWQIYFTDSQRSIFFTTTNFGIICEHLAPSSKSSWTRNKQRTERAGKSSVIMYSVDVGLTFEIKQAFKDLKIEFAQWLSICSITLHVVQFMRKILAI